MRKRAETESDAREEYGKLGLLMIDRAKFLVEEASGKQCFPNERFGIEKV